MNLRTYFLIFSSFLSVTKASHFLGGSFTYRQNPQTSASNDAYISIFVEIRFHISHHYFNCTGERVNRHTIGYLAGDTIPYDSKSQQHLWFQVGAYIKQNTYYDIYCSSIRGEKCVHFTELMWAYCESANANVQYSILRRQFALSVSKSQELKISHASCCWATSTNKAFYFQLNIRPVFPLNNSSPYPYIPASYYVSLKHPREIPIFIYDADGKNTFFSKCHKPKVEFGGQLGDGVRCETSNDTLDGFLTVRASPDCKLSYQHNQLNKQFGQFWLIDTRNNQILSRSLISVQVHVLDNIICTEPPELIVKNQADGRGSTGVQINRPVHISVSLRPNCPGTPLEVQSITELTTFCSNERPVVTAENGIEIVYHCTPILCEKHQICFVGEFNLTLPSTNVVCFQIDASGNKDECADATERYNYSAPHERDFKIWNPIEPKSFGDKRRSPIQTVVQHVRDSTVVPVPSTSRKWLWISIVSCFLLIALLGYFAFPHILAKFHQYSMQSNQQRFSSRDGSFDTVGTVQTIPHAGEKLNRNSQPRAVEPDTISISSSTSKARSQHLRIGPFDEYD